MRTAVICIGNELLLDEGAGPACGRYLAARFELPAEVEVLDRSVMGMSVISDLRDHDVAVVVDAVDVPGAEPGQLFSFEPDDVAPTPPGALSLHEMRFADVLASAELLGVECRGHCFGVQVENMSPSEFVMALTPRVAAAVPLLACAVARYLRDELGYEVCDRLDEDPTLATGLPGPEVLGEPDVSVLAGYLASGLAAVGAHGACDGADAGAVRFELPVGADATCLPGALDPRVVEEGESLRLVATVAPASSDRECDELIGRVREIVQAAR